MTGDFHYRGWVGFTQSLVSDLHALVMEADCNVAGPLGHGMAEIGTRGVSLNGVAALNECFGSFVVVPAVNHSDTGLCRTNGYPYTELVGAMLILINETTEDRFKIGSRGWNADFETGEYLFIRTFDRVPAYRLSNPK